ncbi:MAG: lipid-A-disaccharide synthase [Alphaproteobacteria bacterium]|nr:lipid-A-disaccharide synthase [Alphaproteobacteria bacterium]
MAERPLVYLVAGEPSGDQLGARLVAALRAAAGDRIAFAGVGGPRLAEQGVQSLFPIDDLSVMGLLEVLPHLPRLLRRMRETEADIVARRPDLVVTIDSPGFTFRLASRLRRRLGRSLTMVHYVAPSVWAWKPKRAAATARLFDHLLTLLPFEPPYFEREGLATTFVGHAAIEQAPSRADGLAFRRRHGIPDDALVLALLPGSRRGELQRHWDVFAAAAGLLAARHPRLRLVVPTVEALEREVRARAGSLAIPAEVGTFAGEKGAALAACDVALAASGTVAVELAAAGVPCVVAYRIHPITYRIVKRMIRVRFASVINLLLDRPAVPELLQEACRPDSLDAALEALVGDPGTRAAQIAQTEAALTLLGKAGPPPSVRAAEALLRLPALAKGLETAQ